MASVAQALDTFIGKLALTPEERDQAERQRKIVQGLIEDGLSVKEPFISGSFGRGTAITPLHDIDLFLTLNRSASEDLRSGDPNACLKKIRTILHAASLAKEMPRLQGRSVNIEASPGFGFDVVPAFQDPRHPEVYEIPDRNTGGWIRSNPRVHEKYSIEADERAGKMAKRLVKALKHWNSKLRKRPVRSFHLELMVYEALPSQPDSLADGLAHLFEALANRVMRPCADPAGLVADVSAGFSEARRQRAQTLLCEAAKTAQKALAAGKDGHTEVAHYHWYSLFGDPYPEPGKAPGAAAPAVTTSPRTAPDDPGKRFG